MEFSTGIYKILSVKSEADTLLFLKEIYPQWASLV